MERGEGERWRRVRERDGERDNTLLLMSQRDTALWEGEREGHRESKETHL